MSTTIPTVPPQAAPVLEYLGHLPEDKDGNAIELPIFATVWYLFWDAIQSTMAALSARVDAIVPSASATALLFNVPGTIGIRSNAAPLYTFTATQIFTQLDAYVKVAPVGASIIAKLYADTTLIGTVTILAGATSGSATVAAGTVNAGQLITMDITQVGTTFPGGDLSVVGRY